jgi:flagellin
MVQTFEGALTETHNILSRMKTLATQSANGTYDDQVDRAAIELEYEQLTKELDDIAATDFNGVSVLTGGRDISGAAGTAAGTASDPSADESFNTDKVGTSNLQLQDSVSLQVGARTKDLKEYDFDYSGVYTTLTEADALIAADVAERANWQGGKNPQVSAIGGLTADLDVTAAGLGLNTNTNFNSAATHGDAASADGMAVSLSTQTTANAAMDKIDKAINKTSMVRATFGAIQNRLEHKIDNLNVTNENLTAAESRIRDTDMAQEVVNSSKQQILKQASNAMLAQANQLPQSVLQLLQ